MKYVFLFLIFVNHIFFAQVASRGDSMYELFIGTRNCTGQTNVFTSTSIAEACWDNSFHLTSEYYNGTEDIILVGNTNPSDYDVWHHGYDFLRSSGQTMPNDEYGGVLGLLFIRLKTRPQISIFILIILISLLGKLSALFPIFN